MERSRGPRGPPRGQRCDVHSETGLLLRGFPLSAEKKVSDDCWRRLFGTGVGLRHGEGRKPWIGEVGTQLRFRFGHPSASLLLLLPTHAPLSPVLPVPTHIISHHVFSSQSSSHTSISSFPLALQNGLSRSIWGQRTFSVPGGSIAAVFRSSPSVFLPCPSRGDDMEVSTADPRLPTVSRRPETFSRQ